MNKLVEMVCCCVDLVEDYQPRPWSMNTEGLFLKPSTAVESLKKILLGSQIDTLLMCPMDEMGFMPEEDIYPGIVSS